MPSQITDTFERRDAMRSGLSMTPPRLCSRWRDWRALAIGSWGPVSSEEGAGGLQNKKERQKKLKKVTAGCNNSKLHSAAY